ncbi:MAG: mechanosensitive ion channel [Candidatus Bathyarchaeia archaeon]
MSEVMQAPLDVVGNLLASIVAAIPLIISAIITLIISYVILKVLTKGVKATLEKARIPLALSGMLMSIVSMVFWYFVILAVLSSFGPPLSPMVAALGSIFAFLALGIGLAMSGVLKDLVSGAFLVTDKDFGVGFKVKAGGVEGTVVGVDIRKTRILDKDGVLHVIPNAVIEPAEWLVYQRAEAEKKQA